MFNSNNTLLYSQKASNMFTCTILVVILLFMLNNGIFENITLKLSLYAVEMLFIAILYKNTVSVRKVVCEKNKIIAFFILLSINILFSQYDPDYANIIKYVGYLCAFLFGAKIGLSGLKFKPTKWILYVLIIAPLLIVAFFDTTQNQSLFFPNSNNLVYWGICVSLFYYCVNIEEKRSLIYGVAIFLGYVFVGSSLGVIVAFLLSIIIINRKNTRLMNVTILVGVLCLIGILYSDLSIFKRVRDVISVFQNMSLDDWKGLRDINMYELGAGIEYESGRTDATSSIWRLQHWMVLIIDFFENWYYSFLLGLGDNYTANIHELKPHNDVLRVMCEYGIVVFGIIYSWYDKMVTYLKYDKCFYLVLAICIYHVTENLIDAFPANSLFYFCLGYLYWRKKTLGFI